MHYLPAFTPQTLTTKMCDFLSLTGKPFQHIVARHEKTDFLIQTQCPLVIMSHPQLQLRDASGKQLCLKQLDSQAAITMASLWCQYIKITD